MKTYTGREMAAKLRDGDFKAVQSLASLPTYDATGDRRGTAHAARVRLPASTLASRLDKTKFNIIRKQNDGTVLVQLMA